ncbi:hypothetical protein PanWU01x14_064610 [Parasponia andersonii]|uniref:Uncharacterized protein n=1 Tax=Parasponia andersonii TaxID=3476 RepID=A0A2P5DHG0_PARAD|nr:hypothetical protein PanWU01x14_064610 [Parasponia andersonii]
MAKLQISPVALPLVVPPPLIKIKNSIPCHAESQMTPFSAVAPARFLAISSRLVQVHEISLDTIYEEEIYVTSTSTTTTSEDHDDFVETAAFKSLPASRFISTTCFLEVQQSFSSVSNFGRSNFQCAN